MLVVGLSGGVATGKSTVSAVFRQNGIPVIDADLVARQVVQPGHPTYVKLRAAFGEEFFDDASGGVLRREKLGKAVFTDLEMRKKLNAITHPSIRYEMLKQLLYHLFTGTRYIVFDTPLLFEVGYDKWIRTTIVVWCEEEIELKRMMTRDGFSREDALTRIAAQMSIGEEKKRAKILIDNNGTRDELLIQVEEVIRKLNSSWSPILVRVVIAVLFGLLSSWIIGFFR
ncbi:unnamed protein product [Caenorhabditis auriculariae]|uniref:Dephospho-CoA kinase n=1 Tax=Caenorhabditis auriculariae TaxID=2777116 RepID=A0A8S1HJX1_9PELO|nr:unnamed protein product [Caenorhabditis auriculariae]